MRMFREEDEENISLEEANIRAFERGITYVESLVTLTHGERKITPTTLMMCLMEDVNLRNYAIDVTETGNFVGLVRRCVYHYGLKNGSWAEHMKKMHYRSKYVGKRRSDSLDA